MPEEPAGPEASQPPSEEAWHRQVAVAAFNRAWDLIDAEHRSPADEREMLATAFASRYHWERAGGPEQWSVSDWQIGRVASLLGEPGLALRYAATALERVQHEGWTGWKLASACEGMARAYAAAGNASERDRYVALASEALATEPDPEEREIIAGQLATLPEVG